MLLSLVVFWSSTQVSMATEERNENKSVVETDFSGKEEIVELRSENSRTYEADGKRTVFLSTKPLNYQASDGKYYPINSKISTPQQKSNPLRSFMAMSSSADNINNSTTETNEDKYPFKSLENTLQAEFGRTSKGGVILKHGAAKIEFVIEHPNESMGEVSENKIRYPKIFDHCDLEFTTLPGEIKDELIFYEAPETPVLKYRINLNGLKYRMTKDGAVEIIDDTNEVVFKFNRSFMYEQKRPESYDAYRAIETRFHVEKGQLFCDLILDMKWLKDRKRSYPIVVDPTCSIWAKDLVRKIVYHSPVSGQRFICTISGEGPKWLDQWFTKYYNYDCYVKDLQTGEVFVHYNDRSGAYGGSTEIPKDKVIAGHDYEVSLYGGLSKRFLETHSGNVTATISYESIVGDQVNACSIIDSKITKQFSVKYSQKMTFRYIPGLKIKEINGIEFGGLEKNYVDLIEGKSYEITLEPKIENGKLVSNYVSFRLPRLTSCYEEYIEMDTGSGYISSAFQVPTKKIEKKFLLEYDMQASLKPNPGRTDVYVESNEVITLKKASDVPSMDLWIIKENVYSKNFDLINRYTNFCGGEVFTLEKNRIHFLSLSGTVGTVKCKIQNIPNTIPEVSEFTLTDEAGNPVTGWAKSSYGLQFKYHDQDNGLKEYKLNITKGSTKEELPPYYTDGQTLDGIVKIPKNLNELGLKDGDKVECQLTEVWDGFDMVSSKSCSFTIDDTAPTLNIDLQKTQITTDNFLNLEFKASDNLNGSGLKSNGLLITWTVNGKRSTSLPLNPATTTNYKIENLPANAKVEVALQVADNVNNLTSKNLTFYTYPEKSQLVAPTEIRGDLTNGYQAVLKIQNVGAPYYKIERYRNQIAPANLDYSTEYLDGVSLGENVGSIINRTDKPAVKHTTYYYRVYTKNGEKEVFTDSPAITVANSNPQIISCEPSNGSSIYSNGSLKFNLNAKDPDGDVMTYKYLLLPVDSSTSIWSATGTGEKEAKSIPNGDYQWQIIINDGYQETVATGRVTVDSSAPKLSLKVNQGSNFTNQAAVKIEFAEVGANTSKVYLSNDGTAWTEVDWKQTLSWNLSTGDGVKTIYAKAQSNAGVSSSVAKYQLTYDATSPSNEGFKITKHGENGKVCFNWQGGSDELSGLAGVNILYWKESKWVEFSPCYSQSSFEIPGVGYDTEVRIKLRLLDRAGNSAPDWVEVIGHTKAAPSSIDLTTTTSGFDASSGHYINLKLKPAVGAKKYQVECTQNPGGGYSGEIPSNTLTYNDTGLKPHGKYIYKVYTINSDGELTVSTGAVELQVKNSFVQGVIGVSPAGYVRQLGNLKCTFDKDLALADPDGDLLQIEYYLSSDGATYLKVTGAYLDSLTDNHRYSWYARITDGYGGELKTAPVSFITDATLPTITVNNLDLNYKLEHFLKASASDLGSGLASLKGTLNGVELIDLTQEIRINTHGENKLQIVATDKAGNVSTFNHLYYIDRTPPVVKKITFTLPETTEQYLAATEQIPVELRLEDPETGVAGFKYIWSDSATKYDATKMITMNYSSNNGTYLATLPGEFSDGKRYYLHIEPTNYLGQKGVVTASKALFYDHTSPIVQSTKLQGTNLVGGINYLGNLALLGFEYQAVDPDSGLGKVEYSFVEGDNLNQAVWNSSLADLKTKVTLLSGHVYRLAVKFSNLAGKSIEVLSAPIFFDQTAPVMELNVPAETANNEVYLGEVTVNDEETTITQVVYKIGTAPDKNDLSLGLTGADAAGWLTAKLQGDYLKIYQRANIPEGTSYYLTVKATNIAGVSTQKISTGTKVKSTATLAPEVIDDGVYTSEKNRLHFCWRFNQTQKPIKYYEYQLRTSETIVKAWTVSTTDTLIQLEGLTLENNLKYFCEVRAKYQDNTYSPVGISNGILIDYTIPQIYSFKPPVFAGKQGVQLSWGAYDAESGVNCLVGLGENPKENSLTKGWIPVGNLRDYLISHDLNGEQIKLENGKKYYLTLVAINGAGLVTEVASGAIVADLTPPPVPVVEDEGMYSNRSDRLKAIWKWSLTDPESGIKEYLYTITTTPTLTGGEAWLSSNLATEIELNDLNLQHGKIYYLAVKTVNQAGGESLPGFSDGILIDETRPTTPLVVDYGDYSLLNHQLNTSVFSSDPETGIAKYQLSLGTLELPEIIFKDQIVLTTGGMENPTFNGLNLEEGKIYFFTVAAYNGAGIRSLESKSDGIMVDTKLPIVTKVTLPNRYIAKLDQLNLEWEAKNSPSGVASAEYALSSSPNPIQSELIWKEISLNRNETLKELALEDAATYYVFVRIQNYALYENAHEQWSVPVCSNPVTIDLTAPVILNLYTPENKSSSKSFLFQWEGLDKNSGITEYRYALGSTRGENDLTNGWVSLVTKDSSVSFYRTDLPLVHGGNVYLSVMAKNGAGLWSEIYKTDGIKINLNRPIVSKLSYNSAYTTSKTSLTGIEWAGVDPISSIKAYRVAVLKLKDFKDLTTAVVPVTQTSGRINLTDLGLLEGETYYLALQVQNNNGTWSEVRYSSAIKVDTLAPVLSWDHPAPELLTNIGELMVTWKASEALGKVEVKLKDPAGFETTEVVALAEVMKYHFRQTTEGLYTLSLTPTDAAGNLGATITQKIRINTKPIVVIGPDLVVSKGTTVNFDPQISNDYGTIAEYQWNLGNGETSNIAKPSVTYSALGEYLVTLKVKNSAGKWSELATQKITVTNTTMGELKADETWTENMQLTGKVIVPKGKTLTIQAGTKILVQGNYRLQVLGKILVNGTALAPVTISGATNWEGIKLEKCDPLSKIQYATISNALTGIGALESQFTINNVTFKNNRIGMQLVKASPALQGCIFSENFLYGVKEDQAAAPSVKDCTFNSNGAAYYEDKLAIISIEKLNTLGSNQNNVEN